MQHKLHSVTDNMCLLDRYLVREWLKVFSIMIMATIGILVMEDIYKNLHNFISQGGHTKDILLFYGIKCIEFIPIVITISIFLSLLYVLGNFNRNNEITALRAAGVSLWRISLPFLVAAGLCSIALFYLNAKWVPWATERARQLQLAIECKQKDVLVISDLSFENPEENRLWIFNQFHPTKSYGVSIYQLNKHRAEVERIVAKEAIYDNTMQLWHFFQARVISLDEKTGEITHSQFFENLDKAFKETPRDLWLLQQKPRNLSLNEIHELIVRNPNLKATHEFQVRYYEVLLLPISCLIVAILAIPFSVTGIRVNPLTGISKSISWFFVYYLLINIGSLIANQGYFSALLSVLLPNILMLAIAGILYRKAIIQ